MPLLEQQSASTGDAWEDVKATANLVLFQAALGHGLVPLLLEGDDDQSHKDVDEEEGEDHEVDHVEDGRLHAEARVGPVVLIGGVHRVLQDPAGTHRRR